MCSFLVVTSGNPSLKSKRIWWPNTDRVPVPVRSVFSTPCSNTWRMKSSYWLRIGRRVGFMAAQFSEAAPGTRRGQPLAGGYVTVCWRHSSRTFMSR